MKTQQESHPENKHPTYTDKYVKKNWKRFIMALTEHYHEELSDSYQKESIKYWAEKYK